MAITWEYTLTVRDLAAKLVDVEATRTEDQDVRSYSLPGVSADTHDVAGATIKATVAARMRALYDADIAAESAVATLLNGWEAALKTATEALEV